MRLHLPAALSLLLSLPAAGLTITVTTSNDQFDTPSGPQISLREAIRDAGAGDTVDFSPGLSGLGFSLQSTYGGTLDIDAKALTIDASSLTDPIRVKHLFPAGAGRLMKISNNSVVTIIGVEFADGDESGNGGALHADSSTLTLDTCLIEDCSADDGGGVYGSQSAISLVDSTVRRCTASGAGGGVFTSGAGGSLNLTRTGVLHCSAIHDGGGIFNFDNALFDLAGSTVAYNEADAGAGIYNGGATQLRAATSLIAANRTPANGGGIFITGSASMLLRNTTVAHNQALQGGGIFLDDSASANLNLSTVAENTARLSGGGIFADTADLTLRNSAIATNGARRGPDIDKIGGTITRVEVNLIGENATVSSDFPLGAPNVNGDLCGSSSAPLDPLLAALGEHGGNSECMPPLSGSPLIDKAGVIGSINIDQRGFTRPVGAAPDLGAVEAAAPDLVTTAVDENNGFLGGGTGVSLREALLFGTSTRIGFAPALDGATCNLGSEIATPGRVALVDASNLPNSFKIDGGGTHRLLYPSAGASISLHHLILNNGFNATQGGAVFVEGDSTFTADRCQFTNNTCNHTGGAIRAADSAVIVSDCEFSANKATGSAALGGAISTTGRLDVRGTLLSNNQAVDTNPVASAGVEILGGAIHFESTDELTIHRSVLDSNLATGYENLSRGGGIYCIAGGTAWLIDSTFRDNTASTTNPTAAGGGFHGFGETHISGCTFDGNKATSDNALSSGGGLLKGGTSDLTIVDSTFTGNSAIGPVAQDRGGAMTIDNCDAYLTHVTIVDNVSIVGVGGISLTGFSELFLENCILANTTFGPTPDIDKAGTAGVTPVGPNFVSHNATVAAEFPHAPPLVGSGGSVQDPGLGALADHGGPTATMAPLPGSPVIDAGQSISPVFVDQRAYPRLRGAAPDLGAHETGNGLTYPEWAAEMIPAGPDATFEGSAIGDLTANGTDYASNFDPLVQSPGPLTLQVLSPTEVQLSFPFNPLATDLIYTLGKSNTLAGFSGQLVIDLSTLGTTAGGLTSVDIDPITESVTCIYEPGPGETEAFWNLTVELSP